MMDDSRKKHNSHIRKNIYMTKMMTKAAMNRMSPTAR